MYYEITNVGSTGEEVEVGLEELETVPQLPGGEVLYTFNSPVLACSVQWGICPVYALAIGWISFHKVKGC